MKSREEADSGMVDDGFGSSGNNAAKKPNKSLSAFDSMSHVLNQITKQQNISKHDKIRSQNTPSTGTLTTKQPKMTKGEAKTKKHQEEMERLQKISSLQSF